MNGGKCKKHPSLELPTSDPVWLNYSPSLAPGKAPHLLPLFVPSPTGQLLSLLHCKLAFVYVHKSALLEMAFPQAFLQSFRSFLDQPPSFQMPFPLLISLLHHALPSPSLHPFSQSSLFNIPHNIIMNASCALLVCLPPTTTHQKVRLQDSNQISRTQNEVSGNMEHINESTRWCNHLHFGILHPLVNLPFPSMLLSFGRCNLVCGKIHRSTHCVEKCF
jgi:hypothetical protein